jgi:hypothetical protein
MAIPKWREDQDEGDGGSVGGAMSVEEVKKM